MTAVGITDTTKLDSIAAEAHVNFNVDWNVIGTDAEIFNELFIRTAGDHLANATTAPGATVSDAVEAAAASGGEPIMPRNHVENAVVRY